MLESLIRWCGEKIENEAALPFHEAAAEKYGKICADLNRKGTPIGTKDMLITGHAKAKECVLVTNRVREFERVEGLLVENWSE